MIRGTTPTFQLKLNGDVDLTEADNVYATFEQGCYSTTKTGDDIEVSEDQVDVYFDQSESLKFRQGFVDIQLNWTFDNGKRACSNIVKISVGKNLIGKVLP